MSEQFLAGHDISKATDAFATLCQNRERGARERMAKMENRLADVSAKNDAGDGVPTPFAAAPTANAGSARTDDDAEGVAKAEWQDMDAKERGKWVSEEVYVAAQDAQDARRPTPEAQTDSLRLGACRHFTSPPDSSPAAGFLFSPGAA